MRLYLKKALVSEYFIDRLDPGVEWSSKDAMDSLHRTKGRFAERVLVDAQHRLCAHEPDIGYLGTWPTDTHFLGNKIVAFSTAFNAILKTYRIKFKRISKDIKSMAKKINKRGQPYKPSSLKNRVHSLNAKRCQKIADHSPFISNKARILRFFFNIPTRQFDFVKAFISNIIFDYRMSPSNLPNTLCPHFLLSSSQVFDLMSAEISLNDFHFSSNNFANRLQGRQAENYVGERHPKFHKGFAVRSRRLPFIVAKPDYLLPNPPNAPNTLQVVEVKSAKDWVQVFDLMDLKMPRAVAQVRTAMFVFETLSSQMFVVKVNEIRDHPDFEILHADQISYDGYIEGIIDPLISRYIKLILMPYMSGFFDVKLLPWERSQIGNQFRKLYQQKLSESCDPQSFTQLQDSQLTSAVSRREVCRKFI